ncbi:condensin complex subunit 2 [Nematocida major]|uniref:condensin complex subunit 2 n=1 Tax=Nematocida major TaxID=1912982 RepID=UPI002007D196|nr:condensin complex subunit 2 [Nematocida major]KAH9386287.1 condensin complex subunit 2 [Nematocida major]
MATAEREVAELLKESTESKINTKTTWSSTLIDDFSNIERFKEKETNSVNFQHASIVLDGCVKVYSTRVDSVVDEAEKLMGSVGRAKEPERQRARAKAHPTIEPNPEAILIRPKIASADDEILEYLARESKEGDTRGLLMHLLKWSDAKGFHVLPPSVFPEKTEQKKDASAGESPQALQDPETDFSSLHASMHMGGARKHISPMFSAFTPDKSVDELVLPTYAYHISYDTEPLEYAYRAGADAFGEYAMCGESVPAEDSESGERAEAPEEHSSLGQAPAAEARPSKEELRLVYTPFGYSKGWAGPSHWKVRPQRRMREREKPEGKEKKKAVIDFLTDTHLPISALFERGKGIVIDPQQISERRKNCNTLPPDQNVRVEDLYRMFMYPGSLYLEEKAAPDAACSEESAPLSINGMEEGEYLEQDAPETLVSDAQERPSAPQSTLLSRRLLQGALRRARRNDIVKVKENMWSQIEQGEKKVDEMYTTLEGQKVSVQFYLVSLLHLANEKNLRITSESAEPLPSIADLLLNTSTMSA